MRKGDIGNCISLAEAIHDFGTIIISKLEEVKPKPSGAMMDDDDDVIEYTASRTISIDSEYFTLTAYYYQTIEDVDECSNLSELGWEIECIEVNSHRKSEVKL